MKRYRLKWLLAALGLLLLVYFFVPPALPTPVESVLRRPERFELLSLADARPDAQGQLPANMLHSRQVLGQAVVLDAAVQDRLTHALRRGACRTLFPILCFNPRHDIRVTTGGVVTDVLICFECEQCEAWQGDRCIARWYTSGSPQKQFDAALMAMGLPLTKPAS